MDNKVKNIIQYIFWAAVAVVLVWFCVKAIDWKEFLAALRMCRWEYVAMSFVVGCVFIVVRGLRWHMLIKPLDPSITKTDVINAYGIGFIANLVLPKLGEAIKIGYIVKDSGKGADGKRHLTVDAAIGTYLAEKAVDAVILIACIVVFLAGSWGAAGQIGGPGGWRSAAAASPCALVYHPAALAGDSGSCLHLPLPQAAGPRRYLGEILELYLWHRKGAYYNR